MAIENARRLADSRIPQNDRFPGASIARIRSTCQRWSDGQLNARLQAGPADESTHRHLRRRTVQFGGK